ncbi:MAG TPA: hypothetical protein VJ742_00740 [Nitrososphaera sp.]|nr:hypothetical protein [Nitrososphaera sp.]
MTDKVHSLTVVLGRDIRTDEIERIMDAIRLLRPVLRVDMNISDISAHVAESRARAELTEKIWNALEQKL